MAGDRARQAEPPAPQCNDREIFRPERKIQTQAKGLLLQSPGGRKRLPTNVKKGAGRRPTPHGLASAILWGRHTSGVVLSRSLIFEMSKIERLGLSTASPGRWLAAGRSRGPAMPPVPGEAARWVRAFQRTRLAGQSRRSTLVWPGRVWPVPVWSRRVCASPE